MGKKPKLCQTHSFSTVFSEKKWIKITKIFSAHANGGGEVMAGNCFAHQILVSTLWLHSNMVFLVAKRSGVWNLAHSAKNLNVYRYTNIMAPQLEVFWMRKNEEGGKFRVWDVTKNVTSQHSQIALTKIRCAKQYAKHCNAGQQYMTSFSPPICSK